MDPEKPKFNWQRMLITTGIVLVAALVIGGTTWYVMDKSAKEIKTANDKSVSEFQKEIDDLNSRLEKAEVTTADTAKTNAGTTNEATATIKGALSNTYSNKECAFSIKYPDGYKITYGGSNNAIFSSISMWAPDNAVNISCTGGDANLIKSYNDYSTGTLAMKYLIGSDGAKTYYTVSNGGKLIAIEFADPNDRVLTMRTNMLASLVLN